MRQGADEALSAAAKTRPTFSTPTDMEGGKLDFDKTRPSLPQAGQKKPGKNQSIADRSSADGLATGRVKSRGTFDAREDDCAVRLG